MASRQEANPGASGRKAALRRTVSRDDLTEAAIALVERDGLDALTMRRLAAELDRAPMSLYTHVRSRDDLVDAIVARLIERLGLREVPGESWQEVVRRIMRSYRDLAVQLPHSFELLALAPYDTSPVAPHLAGTVACLESGGLGTAEARQILGIVDAYATGFLVVWARSQAAERRPGADAAPPEVTGMRELETFEQGLEALIAGLDATLVRAEPVSGPPASSP
ncbi:TetR/AcrR family transcriptional regulator [Agromyces lapidis]|uniref:TetR/AcrR family transcriptional regulator n=1 Tax=Agromyces lapidis TaxID=279574 RepID=A0ABV5SS17_9MICO|nr:TetR/AcrR family transcriptional regulator [Agromyces lapidis]